MSEPDGKPERDGSPIVRLLDRELDAADHALARRLRKIDSDPSLVLAALIRAVDSEKAESGDRLASQLEEAIKAQEKSLAAVVADVRDLKRDSGTAKWIVRGALTSALGALVYVATKIWTRAEVETESRIRIEYLRQQADRHEAEIERLRSMPWPRKDSSSP